MLKRVMWSTKEPRTCLCGVQPVTRHVCRGMDAAVALYIVKITSLLYLCTQLICYPFSEGMQTRPLLLDDIYVMINCNLHDVKQNKAKVTRWVKQWYQIYANEGHACKPDLVLFYNSHTLQKTLTAVMAAMYMKLCKQHTILLT